MLNSLNWRESFFWDSLHNHLLSHTLQNHIDRYYIKLSIGSVPASSELCLARSSFRLELEELHSGKVSIRNDDSKVCVSVCVSSVESWSSISFQGVWVCILHKLNGFNTASSSTVCVSALDPSQGLEGLSAPGESAVLVCVPRLFIRSFGIQ